MIVNDFIDMRKEQHRRGVERALRDAVKRDRARTKILRTSPFGLIEMTRQRIRPSLKRSVYKDCPSCGGTGVVKTAESMAIEVVRKLLLRTHLEQVSKVTVTVEDEVASYLNNKKRRELAKIEDDNNVADPGRQRRRPLARVLEARLLRRQRPRSEVPGLSMSFGNLIWRTMHMAVEKIEKRMAQLEQEVAALRKKLDDLAGSGPWWERIAGSFRNDRIYQQAMRLGKQYRREQKPNGSSSGTK